MAIFLSTVSMNSILVFKSCKKNIRRCEKLEKFQKKNHVIENIPISLGKFGYFVLLIK